MRPFPAAMSVIVLDNSSLHHDQHGILTELVEAQGGKLLFLPPYSPKLMPIELSFACVNRFLRANAEEYAEDPRAMIDAAFESIGADKALGYILKMYQELDAVDPANIRAALGDW